MSGGETGEEGKGVKAEAGEEEKVAGEGFEGPVEGEADEEVVKVKGSDEAGMETVVEKAEGTGR